MCGACSMRTINSLSWMDVGKGLITTATPNFQRVIVAGSSLIAQARRIARVLTRVLIFPHDFAIKHLRWLRF